MIIRKTQQPSDYPSNSISNAKTTGTTNTYSCDYINELPAFVEMFVNGSQELTSNNTEVINIWGNTNNISVGGFECDPSNNRIIIPPNTCEYIEIFGEMSGYNSILSYIQIYDSANLNTSIADIRLLVQPGGNKYYAASIGSKIVKIPDKSKTYYVMMSANGYNTDATFNQGFGDTFSYIGVKKIK